MSAASTGASATIMAATAAILIDEHNRRVAEGADYHGWYDDPAPARQEGHSATRIILTGIVLGVAIVLLVTVFGRLG